MPSQFEALVNSGHPAVTLHIAPSPSQPTASTPQPIQYTQIPPAILRILDSDMSSTAPPISAAAFADALTSLELPTLHAKAAEIRNQRAHLFHSNAQLQEFADEGDEDCREAIQENAVVLQRMNERLGLLKKEVVENRGMIWVEEEQRMDIDRRSSGEVEGVEGSGDAAAIGEGELTTAQRVLANGAVGGTEVSGDAATVNRGERVAGQENIAMVNGDAGGGARQGQSGSLGDEELARRLRERMGEDGAEEDEGVHL